MHIINNSSPERAFADLFTQEDLPKVTKGILNAINKSFPAEEKTLSRAEVRRRMGICIRIIQDLRGDLSWGLQRIMDHLPQYLKCELDGISWKPDERTVWAPGDGN